MWPIFLVHESIPFWKLRSRNHRRVGTSAARVALDRTIHRLRGGMMSLKLPYRWMTVHSMTKWWPNCSLLMFFCVFWYDLNRNIHQATPWHSSTTPIGKHRYLWPPHRSTLGLSESLAELKVHHATTSWRSVASICYTYLFFQVPPQKHPQIISIKNYR